MQAIICQLEVDVINSHLALLHPRAAQTSLTTACGAPVEDYSIGSLVLNEARLGLGVISAIVGSNAGWMVTMFENIQEQLVSVSLEWTIQEGYCWFELEEIMGFNQSIAVICHNIY